MTDQMTRAAEILEGYAEFIKAEQADNLERHPYIPDIDEAARILRAAAGVDVDGLIELAAKAIYDQWADQHGWVEWVLGGNSMNQDEARRIARAALESALRLALAAREGRAKLSIGDYTLNRYDENSIWIESPIGEAGQFSEEKLSAVVRKFYDDNF